MAITDINISEQLQTDAPSIKYTGNEGPQASPQHQQEMQIAQQIWEGMRPEQQAQFQSFEQFFQSGIWKQILQQMQADQAQGQAQGIAGLGPRTEEIEEVGIQSLRGGGRIGFRYGKSYDPQRRASNKSAIMKEIQWLMTEFGMSRDEAIERVLSNFRRSEPPNPIQKFSEEMIADMRSRVDPSQIKENPFDIKVPNIDPSFEIPGSGENIDRGFERELEPGSFAIDKYQAPLRQIPMPMGRTEEEERIGIGTLRGRP